MRITRRRMDFLQTIKQLYESTKLPVHYVRVAELLGISKWSAYEMLKNLEKEGLLTSQYEVNQGEKYPGRAMVLFAPTHLVNLVLSGKPLEVRTSLKEWRQVQRKLLSLYEQPENSDSKALLEQLLDELPDIESPLIFSAYIITVLTAQLQTFNSKSINLIKNLLTNTETGLAMFVGTVIGSMLKTSPHSRLLSQLTNQMSGFQEKLAELNQAENALLMDFLDEALQKAI